MVPVADMVSCQEFFKKLAPRYDLMVPWSERLRTEKPFFRNIFKKFGVRSIFDVCCGTGKHLVLFDELGLETIAGSDLSLEMTRIARRTVKGRKIQVVRGELPSVPTRLSKKSYDAVVCLGDSLPFLFDDGKLLEAFNSFHRLLRPGGLLIIQNRNYDRIWPLKERYLPIQSGTQNRREHIFFSFFEFYKELMTLNVADISRSRGKLGYDLTCTPVRPLVRGELEFFLDESGFRDYRFFGGMGGEKFERRKSAECVVIAAS